MKLIAQGVDSDVFRSKSGKHIMKVYGDVNVKPLKARDIKNYTTLQNFISRKGPIKIHLPRPIKIGNISIKHLEIETLELSEKTRKGEARSGRVIYYSLQKYVEGPTVDKVSGSKEDKETLYTQIAGEIGKHISYMFNDVSGQNLKIKSIESENGGTLRLVITDIGGSIPSLLQRNKDLVKDIIEKK